MRPEIRESVEASQRYQSESLSVIQHNQKCFCDSFGRPSQKKYHFFYTLRREANYRFPASKLDSSSAAAIVKGLAQPRASKGSYGRQKISRLKKTVGGSNPPLGRRTPPNPPLILGSGAGLGQKCGEVVPGGWRGWGRENRRRRRGEGRGWCGERVGREERERGGRRERKEEKGHRFRSNYFE